MTGVEILRQILGELEGIPDPMVFTGGLVLPLYFERSPALRLRPTIDADAVVGCASYARWADLQARLMQRGFVPVSDQEAPICRMRTPQGHLLDVIPTEASVLGFGNRWFRQGFDEAVSASLGEGKAIRIFPAPLFVAAKTEAFRDRGKLDPWLSHDLEDVLTLIECRPSFLEEVRREDGELLDYLAAFATELLALERIDELIESHLRASAEPIRTVLERISRKFAA